MKISLYGKNVILTGASSGIGWQTALLLAEQGANIALAARSMDKLGELEKELSKFDVKVLKVQTDISKITDCKKLIREAVNGLGSIDILVNNAGVTSRGKLDDVDLNDLEQMIEINLKAPVRITKLALPHILKSDSGRIINVASILGIIPLPTEAVYSATKFALRGFSYALAEELEDTGVKVCLICPGPVETPMIIDEMDKISDMVYSPPVSTAKEIAELIVKSAVDGSMERIKPIHTGILAKIGFLFPKISKLVKPIMEKQGADRKKKYIDKYSKSSD
ncbi:MAG TPA: SDR family oxidoreductase [Thermodesulfobacteriota bacterium]|nr:SDR family oxidoreductase [Thermodesulfobacteriota bacterium]